MFGTMKGWTRKLKRILRRIDLPTGACFGLKRTLSMACHKRVSTCLAGIGFHGGHMRLLLVEDDELLGSGIEAGLKQAGYAVD